MFPKRTPKMLVEVMQGNRLKFRRKCVIDGDTVVIEKGHKGRGLKGWTPVFDSDCIIHYRVWFLLFSFIREKVVVQYGADKCVNWNIKPLKMPTYDFATANRLFKLSVLEKAGTLKNKLDVPIGLYLLIGGCLIISLLTFLVTSGKIRI